jgi:oligopeptide/dipeptide ABC transporter ATP-binding protein
MSIDIRRGSELRRVVQDVSFSVAPAEVVGIVGESGAGKSMVARSLLRLLPHGAYVRSGTVLFGDDDLLTCSRQTLRRVRGGEIGLVLQNPLSSLDPTMLIGRQVVEAVELHQLGHDKPPARRAAEMLAMVGLPGVEQLMSAYPHQLSGGMRQRVAIAMALVARPRLLIADEPTTALDVTIQAQILELLMRLQRELDLAIILISHDIAVVSSVANRVVVMYAGEVVEQGPTAHVIQQPLHRYTRSLLDVAIQPVVPTDNTAEEAQLINFGEAIYHPGQCSFANRCLAAQADCLSDKPPWTQSTPLHGAACLHPPTLHISESGTRSPANGSRGVMPRRQVSGDAPVVLRADDVSKDFPVRAGRRQTGTRRAVDAVSLQLCEGETLGVIGESGCGKTTLARLMVGLERPTTGQVFVREAPLYTSLGRPVKRLRRDIQLMFQDPYASLDPRMRVMRSLREPLDVQQIDTRANRRQRVHELLAGIGLTAEAALLFPHEFSGGQRQRLAFARTTILRPTVVVADEPVSALDVSVRSRVLSVMARLRDEFKLSFVIISHDIGTVREMADRIVVMYAGRIVEEGPADAVLETPRHPYTRGLLASVPMPRADGAGFEIPVGVRGEFTPEHASGGCPFRLRCPDRRSTCDTLIPDLLPHEGSLGHLVACHFPAPVSPDSKTEVPLGAEGASSNE